MAGRVIPGLLLVLGAVLASCGGLDDSRPFDGCGDAPSDEACFAATRDAGSTQIALALSIARRQATLQPVARGSWDWVTAVMMESFVDLARVTGDAGTWAWVTAWLDARIAEGYVMSSSDTASPAGVAVPLWQRNREARYRAVIDDFQRYLDQECLRTPEGGLNHLGTQDWLGVTLWVDTLFMVGQPLLRLSLATGDVAPLEEMGKQVGIFIDRMQRPSGFFIHAVDYAIPVEEGIFWGRGNGWVMLSLADYLRTSRILGREDPEALEALGRLIRAAIDSQDAETGLWWTVLNRPGETYLETSVAALFAAGMARAWRNGFAGDEVLPVIARAMAGVKAKVVPGADGPVVTGVSGPTGAGDFYNYKNIGVQDDLPFGIGAVVFALIETSGLPLPAVP